MVQQRFLLTVPKKYIKIGQIGAIEVARKNTPSKATAFRASADVDNIRTETFGGREYTVVPVIALVEGTIQSMNSDKPELCLASEFGKFFVGWNGRPLVMNHPVYDGVPVCANQPEVLEEYQIGWVFNASVAGGKLKVEAWIDNERAADLNTASADALKAMQAGEVVEVSTGLYTTVVDKDGEYEGEEYFGIWTNIVPDHLAILEAGLIGACSAADGCGTNRTNQMATNVKPSEDAWRTMKRKCKSKANTTDEPAANSGTGECQCKTQANANVNANPAPAVNLAQPQESAFPFDTFLANLRANMIPDGMMTRDVENLVGVKLSEAVEEASESDYCYSYIVGITADKVVYGVYESGMGYETYQRSFTVAADGSSVTLGDDIEAVNLITKIVPRTDDVDSSEDGSRSNAESTQSAKENPMKQIGTEVQNNNAPTPTPAAGDGGTTLTRVEQLAANAAGTTSPSADATVTAELGAGGATGKAHTVDSLLANASPEVREVLEEGQRVLAARKNDLIGKLKASNRCKISDARLNTMKVNELEELCELAAIPNYAGLAAAVDPTAHAQRDNAQQMAPVPEPMFQIGGGRK
jgi:hypothetical protein